MMIKKFPLVMLATVLVPMASIAATTDFDTSAQAQEQSMMAGQSAPVPPAPVLPPSSTATPMSAPMSAPQMSSSSSSALEIINTKYVPDDIKKKYHMVDTMPDTPNVSMPTVKRVTPDEMPAASMSKASIAPTVKRISPDEIAPADAGMKSHVMPMKASPAPTAKRISSSSAMQTSSPSLMTDQTVKTAGRAVPSSEYYDTWRAKKGETLRNVLSRWSDRAGADFVWTAGDSPILKNDFSMSGKFSDATQKLLAENAGELQMKLGQAQGNASAASGSITPPTITSSLPVTAADKNKY